MRQEKRKDLGRKLPLAVRNWVRTSVPNRFDFNELEIISFSRFTDWIQKGTCIWKASSVSYWRENLIHKTREGCIKNLFVRKWPIIILCWHDKFKVYDKHALSTVVSIFKDCLIFFFFICVYIKHCYMRKCI